MAAATRSGSRSGGQGHEDDAIGELVALPRGHLQRQAGLAHAARAGQRHQAQAVLAQQLHPVGHLARASDQGGRRAGR